MQCWEERKVFLKCSVSGTKMIWWTSCESRAGKQLCFGWCHKKTPSFWPVLLGHPLLVKQNNTETLKQRLSPLSYTCAFGTVSGHSPSLLPPAFLKARRTSPVPSPESAIRNAKFSACKMASRHCRRFGSAGIRRILAGCRANHSRPAASLKREYDAVVIGAGERQMNEAHITHMGAKEAPHGQI